jgi:AcrR family transcriptional regulator
VRRITEDAGANVAAINYYFGSKDRLIEVALAHTLHEGFGKALGELGELMRSPSGWGPRGSGGLFPRLPPMRSTTRGSRLSTPPRLVDQTTTQPTEVRHFVVGHVLVGPHMPQQDEAERHRAVIHGATIIQLAPSRPLRSTRRAQRRCDGGLLTRTLFGETE